MEKMECGYNRFYRCCNVINPAELKFGYYFIFPLFSAIFLSIRDLVTKNIKTGHNSLQIAFITCLVVTIFFGVLSVYKFYSFNLEQSIILIISAFFYLLVIFSQY